MLQYCMTLYSHLLTTVPVRFFHPMGSLSPRKTRNVETPVHRRFGYDLVEWWVLVNETLRCDSKSNVALGVSAG